MRGNRDRRDDRLTTEEKVYRETERGPTVCRGFAWNSGREFHRTEDPCDPGAAWEHIILKKRKDSCMIEEISLKSYPHGISLFHIN